MYIITLLTRHFNHDISFTGVTSAFVTDLGNSNPLIIYSRALYLLQRVHCSKSIKPFQTRQRSVLRRSILYHDLLRLIQHSDSRIVEAKMSLHERRRRERQPLRQADVLVTFCVDERISTAGTCLFVTPTYPS